MGVHSSKTWKTDDAGCCFLELVVIATEKSLYAVSRICFIVCFPFLATNISGWPIGQEISACSASVLPHSREARTIYHCFIVVGDGESTAGPYFVQPTSLIPSQISLYIHRLWLCQHAYMMRGVSLWFFTISFPRCIYYAAIALFQTVVALRSHHQGLRMYCKFALWVPHFAILHWAHVSGKK